MITSGFNTFCMYERNNPVPPRGGFLSITHTQPTHFSLTHFSLQTALRLLRRCLASTHFQVCLRGLYMLELPSVRALLADRLSACTAICALVAPLARKHWHPPVVDRAQGILPTLRMLGQEGNDYISASLTSVASFESTASMSSGVAMSPLVPRLFDFAASPTAAAAASSSSSSSSLSSSSFSCTTSAPTTLQFIPSPLANTTTVPGLACMQSAEASW